MVYKPSRLRITHGQPILDPQDWRSPVTPEDVATRNGTIRASEHIQVDEYQFINDMLQRWRDRDYK